MNRVAYINTPTGPMALARPVAARLLKEGILTGDLDGEMKARDAAIVKAAVVGHAGLCDFCSAPGPFEAFEVPDFDIGYGQESTGGWAACEGCAPLVKANDRKGLIERACAGLTFSKWTRKSIEELQGKFWQGMEAKAGIASMLDSVRHVVEGTVPSDTETDGKRLADVPTQIRRAALMKALNFSEQELDAALRGETTTAMMRKLIEWHRKSKSPLLRELVKPHPPMPAGTIPHWQRALDAKFETAHQLELWSKETQYAEYFRQAIDMNDPDAVRVMALRATERRKLRAIGFAMDLKHLKHAQAYSFNAETVAAIREAASSIPHDAPLSSIESPNTGAGWFYFAEPLRLRTGETQYDNVQALLWAWDNAPGDNAALMFTAYVIDESGRRLQKGSLAPSTRFYWRFADTFHEMIEKNRSSWRHEYGPDGVLTDTEQTMNENDTVKLVGEIALFYAMACVWFKQRVPVLTKEPGHVERHARKRLQREHKLAEPPTVRVVALRKSLRVAASEAPGDRQESARAYSCRWIVKGHPRLQACGPGRKDRKLIWIEAYIAGPDDKPVRTRETVFAVIR